MNSFTSLAMPFCRPCPATLTLLALPSSLSPTMILKGLPLICCPFLKTLTKCSPTSRGVKEIPEMYTYALYVMLWYKERQTDRERKTIDKVRDKEKDSERKTERERQTETCFNRRETERWAVRETDTRREIIHVYPTSWHGEYVCHSMENNTGIFHFDESYI